MSDIHLYWWSIEAETVTATRAQLAPLAARLGLAEPRSSHTVSFKRAVGTTTEYTDAYGRRHQLHGEVVRQSAEFITVNVLRQDGARMAEWKYFAPRKSSNGRVIPGSHDIRTVMRPGLERDDTIGVQHWLDAAEARFTDATNESPIGALRRMARTVVHTHGVPVLGRAGTAFAYDDDREAFEDLLGLIRTATSGAITATLAIDDDSDLSILITSADVFLTGQLQDLRNPTARTQTRNPSPKVIRTRLNWIRNQHTRHERRLRTSLDLTRSSLEQTEQWIRETHPTGSLRSVDQR